MARPNPAIKKAVRQLKALLLHLNQGKNKSPFLRSLSAALARPLIVFNKTALKLPFNKRVVVKSGGFNKTIRVKFNKSVMLPFNKRVARLP